MTEDRYEPLPGFLQLPGHFYRKLGRTGRRIALALAALAVAGAVVFALTALPSINESKAERQAAEQRAAEQARARRLAQLKAELRLRRGRGAPAATVPERRALVADLTAAVVADARQRVRSGEFAKPAESAECERFPRGPTGEDPADDPSLRTARYSCLAVTAAIAPTETSVAGVVGYPYRALVDFPSGRYTYCKISGRPGELSITREVLGAVPRACGGQR